MFKFNRRSSIVEITAFAALLPGLALFQPHPVTAQTGSAEELEELVVIGSRRAARTSTEAPVPIDVLSEADLQSQGSTDILDVLTNVVPSYNVGREPISDAGTLIRPANLRGMPSDSTLVLVNGKRRHRGAVIGEFITGINKGAQGVDLMPLAGIAMKQVEVLRDGASAQYGSDAIAGVMNFVLADDPEARNLQVHLGQYYEGDGDIWQVSGLLGTHLGREGFATLAFEVKDTGPTSRGVQDAGAQALIDAGNRAVPNYPRDFAIVWGTPIIENDYKFLVNAAVETGENSEVYAFGNYASRVTDGSFFYRNPTNRRGVYVDGNDNLLVADTTTNGSGGCSNVNTPANLAAMIENPNCFVFNEVFPGGFTPRFGGKVIDSNVVSGLRGEWNGVGYDVSVSLGRSEIQYIMRSSLNPSMGPNSPTSFDLGTQIQSERLLNVDFSYPIDLGLASDLNLAFGGQVHAEQFEIKAGDRASSEPGGFQDQGFAIGSNGFQGFSVDVAGRFKRRSNALYLDAEVDVSDNWLASAAFRWEDFEDFGNTSNFKLATRFDLLDNLSLRAAYSTGFRAPTVGQANLRRSSTNFLDGRLVENQQVSPTSTVAVQKGGQALRPEESDNFSVGVVWGLGDLQVTLDYFRIEVEDRLFLKQERLTPQDQAQLAAAGVLNANLIGNISFFVNDFATETSGVDVVATLPLEWGLGTSDFTLSYNFTDTKVERKANSSVPAEQIRELEEQLPDQRINLTALHTWNKWSLMLRGNWYDETFEYLFTDYSIPPVVTPALFVLDAEVGLQVSDSISVNVGAKNVFDERPAEWSIPQPGGGVITGRSPGYAGMIYPLNSAAGLNGGYYYLRVSADF